MKQKQKPINRIETWDIKTINVPDGYDLKSMPDLTCKNLETIVDKINEIIDTLNNMNEKP